MVPTDVNGVDIREWKSALEENDKSNDVNDVGGVLLKEFKSISGMRDTPEVTTDVF